MTNKNLRRPILHKGELYSSSVTKRGGPPPPPKISYEEARKKIISDLDKTDDILKGLPASLKLPNESIVCIKMQPDYSAKTYYPDSLFDLGTEKIGLKEIGSRIWREKNENKKDSGSQGKLIFVRVKENGLSNFKSMLNKGEASLTKSFTEDVRRLSSISVLSAEEKILGFEDNWESGMLEIVLHPFGMDKKIMQDHFYQLLNSTGVVVDNISYKQYDEGITFVSFKGNKDIIQSISNYNPLRTLHPLNIREFSNIVRSSSVLGAPKFTEFTETPKIYVGVFDGGMKIGNKYLDNYVEMVDSVKGKALLHGEEHGTNVTSAILHGAINQYKNSDILPEPTVGVKNFRVVSEDNIADNDLFEVIDAIEMEVPRNKHIQVFNLSIGPSTQILDDNISRFTFACDKLSYKHDILFCSAVGNAGEKTGYNRIQSPSDMVNGLAIGSYTKINGEKVRADYSCIGPGREGNKLKPDLLAFGGCNQSPINLLSYKNGHRELTAGTSFATPLVSKIAALLIGSSKKVINPLIARALLIHSTVENSSRKHDNYIGFGILPENIEQIATCPERSYTLIYNGEIDADKYVEFEIPWVDGIEGDVTFRWTSVISTDVDPNSPDDYTETSILTSFYPNTDVYNFIKELPSNKSSTKKVNVLKDPEKVVQLKAEGYKQSSFPASDSKSSTFQPEHNLKKDLKWDSVDCRELTKRSSGIKKPVFHIHAIRRGQRIKAKKVKYAFILSVETPKSNVDIYSKVVNKYRALNPIKLHIKNIVTASS